MIIEIDNFMIKDEDVQRIKETRNVKTMFFKLYFPILAFFLFQIFGISLSNCFV